MMQIQLEENGTRGRWVLLDGTERAGKMTFERISATVLSIDHTEVHPAFGGKGYGGMLLQEAVSFAREHGLKIRPVCPFVKVKLTRNPDYTDILE